MALADTIGPRHAQGLGGMQEVPKGFNEGFQQGSTSEETKELVRSLGKTVVTVKDTAGDLAGEYKAVNHPYFFFFLRAPTPA